MAGGNHQRSILDKKEPGRNDDIKKASVFGTVFGLKGDVSLFHYLFASLSDHLDIVIDVDIRNMEV